MDLRAGFGRHQPRKRPAPSGRSKANRGECAPIVCARPNGPNKRERESAAPSKLGLALQLAPPLRSIVGPIHFSIFTPFSPSNPTRSRLEISVDAIA